MNTVDLKAKLTELWGGLVKPISVDPQFRLVDHIDFRELDDEALVFLLDVLLKSSGSSGSGFSVDADNYDILDFMRQRMYQIHSISRRLKPVLRCYDIFYGRGTDNNEGQWSLAVMYLISTIENYFRANNPYTDPNGIVTQALPQAINIKKSIGSRVNQIGEIFRIYCHGNNSKFALYLGDFDNEMVSYVNSLIVSHNMHNVIDGVVIPTNYIHQNLVDQMNATRNSVMHGERQAGHDMFLYLTLHSIMFIYDQNMYSNY